MKEDAVISKVRELMDVLDKIKKYSELSRSLNRFVIIVVLTIVAYVGLRIGVITLRYLYSLNLPYFFTLSVTGLIIPIAGLFFGILYVRERQRKVKTGEWNDTLAQGFPGALELISKIDWEDTFRQIDLIKSSSFKYGLARFASYLAFLVLVVAIVPMTYDSIRSLFIAIMLIIPTTILLTFEGLNLVGRYMDSQSLNFLLSELKDFYNEFKGSEFEIKA